jgi:hypothetical protein
MRNATTAPARLDRAIDDLLDGASAGEAAARVALDRADRQLVRIGDTLRLALAPSLVSPRFEARLGARLAGVTTAPWIMRHPGRLIVTGAVGSAVGVGVTAYAVWRSTRRSAASHRLTHR